MGKKKRAPRKVPRTAELARMKDAAVIVGRMANSRFLQITNLRPFQVHVAGEIVLTEGLRQWVVCL